jgi:hypothetical protein
MKLYKKLSVIAMACIALGGAVAITSCSDDEYSTQQFKGGVSLNSFGPSPVARGGELRFIGNGLSQINSVDIPGSESITDIRVISDEEIRVTVPQDAQVGYVTLHYANGTITTKTKLTYTEPISIESVSPLKVKPGQTLTITGDYLNLIKEVCFSFLNDSVNVYEGDFIAHERKLIKLVVPEEAVSGSVVISDAAEIPNMIYADDEIEVVLPAVESAIDITKAKPGDLITITGTDLDLVRTIELPNGNEVEFTLVDENKLTFVLPEDATDGSIVMLPASGVRIAIANIGMVVPTELVATPATELRSGDEITIKGLNLDQVVSITFPNVSDAVAPTSVSSSELKVKWPDQAQSGDIILNLKSGKTVSLNIQTAKPENIAYSSNEVSAGSSMHITGKNLDLIKTIEFGGAQVVELTNPDAAKITVDVPNMAETGALKFTLLNGEVVTAPNLTVNVPEFAYITVFPADDEDIIAGTILKVGIGNSDKLTAVKVGSSVVQYIVNGDYLYINIPESASGSTKITLISSNGSIEYTFDITPATHVTQIIWTGSWDCGSWSGNQDLAWGGFDWTTVPAGAIMTLYCTPTTDGWWCVSLRHGQNWGNLPSPIPGQYDQPENGILQVELTREILDDIINNGGLVITGQGYILSKVTLEWENELETVVPFEWSNVDMGNYSINLEGKPSTALIDAGVKAGKKLRVYMTPTASYNTDNPQVHLQIFDGHWSMMSFAEINGGTQFNESTWGDMTLVTINITSEMAEKFTTLTDWGYCIIFQGNNVIINKVTVGP